MAISPSHSPLAHLNLTSKSSANLVPALRSEARCTAGSHLLPSTEFSPWKPRNFRALRNSRADLPFRRAVCQQQQEQGDGVKREYFLPTTLEESIDQARTASRQAIRNGVTRLQLEVPLPLIGATDLDDWPGGIQQQFKAAGPVVSSLLNGLVDADAYKGEGVYKSFILDEGDAVGVWENDRAALVLFPTAESLDKVEALALALPERPLLLVNAQWQSGQVISDFGFGARRQARENFSGSFQTVYYLKQFRILGEDVRLLKRYPGDWQVFVIGPDGGSECIAVQPGRPSYKEMDGLLRNMKGSNAGQGWFARLLSEFEFNQKSLKE